MKKLLTLGIAISFTCSLLVIPAFGIAKAGAPCTKAGVTSIVSGKKFTCVKSGKKLVWDKGVLIANSTQQKTSPATSVENSQVILLPGSTCKVSSSVGVKVASGTLYCVQVSDGSYKYIEHFDAIPSINNPQSPEPLEACEAPDLRGNIPPEMSILRIAHDSVVSASKLLKHTGTLNLVVVPIDFSDAIGVSTPKSVYGSDFDMMTKWFSDFSNQKLQLSVQMKNNWFRAPLPSANYDPSLWPSNDYDTQQKVVQKYIDLTSPQIDYSSADAVVFVYPRQLSPLLDTFICGMRNSMVQKENLVLAFCRR